MKPDFRPNAGWILAFLCACFVVSELHEQAHIQTGFLLYGAYGPRDFNVWQTAVTDEQRWIASLAGPLFSYLCMWMGLWMSRHYPGPGLALLFCGLPFARVLTAFMGGGDEKVILLSFTHTSSLTPTLRIALALAVLLLAGIPVFLAARRFRIRPLVWLLLLLLPMLVEFPLTHLAYNKLLDRGFGTTVLFGGTPWLIHLHLALMALALFLLRKQLTVPSNRSASNQLEKVAFRRPLLINQ